MPLMATVLYYGAWLAANGLMGPTSPPLYGEDAKCEGGFRYMQETIEKIIVPIMVTFQASSGLGQTLNTVTDMDAANAAAFELFTRLDVTPECDATSDTGTTLEHVTGDIHVRDLVFA